MRSTEVEFDFIKPNFNNNKKKERKFILTIKLVSSKPTDSCGVCFLGGQYLKPEGCFLLIRT